MSPARVNRIRLIRKRVIGGAVALFVAVWGVIGIQLASGNDPALSKTSSTNPSTTSSSASTTQQPQLTTSDQPPQAVSPVTTSQS
jgi:hypothetical protein